MEVRYKKDFYNHGIEKLLPKRLVAPYATFAVDWQLHKIDKMYAYKIDKIIQERMPTPSWVEIETVNRCNNNCAFCPVNRDDDPRPLLKMSDDLFKKIIHDFAAHNYTGAIACFCNNEPFLDRNILQRIAYAKHCLPKAFHFLYTNGSLLTDDRFAEAMKHLDYLIIDNYSRDNNMNPPIRKLWEKYGYDEYPNAVIWMRRVDEIFGTRGGHAPNRTVGKPYLSGCVLPFQHMYIHPDGKVGLCCQDAVWKHPPLGDLSTQSLWDVWNGPGYQKLREHYKARTPRAEYPVCKDCDFVCTGKHPNDMFGFGDD